MIQIVLDACGFSDRRFFLSTRPQTTTVGDAQTWDAAEASLKNALESCGLKFSVDAGAGAFYGPKIDTVVKDGIGRDWQLSTVQLDFNLPKRFDATFRNESGKPEHVVMIHRALLGSFERFMANLIEHFAGAFPTWLSPVQAEVLTIADSHVEYGRTVVKALRAAGLRAAGDFRPETIGLKVRDATAQKCPYLLTVGAREAAAGTVSLRRRGDKTNHSMDLESLIEGLKQEVSGRHPAPGVPQES
ncbi:MAG: hypothetical protein HY611_00220 [Elusimicrobia bacterium]|nr:hypothetical protein [Elusimicrobiota bacterium]